MKTKPQQLASSWAQVFGFFILALVIASGSCRFNRAKAQTTYPTKWCNQAYYQEYYGDDWHIYWALHFCWLYTEPAAEAVPAAFVVKPRLAMRGRS